MVIGKLKFLGLGIVSLVGVSVVVLAYQINKHGGHITLGVGDRDFSWEFVGNQVIEEVGEGN